MNSEHKDEDVKQALHNLQETLIREGDSAADAVTNAISRINDLSTLVAQMVHALRKCSPGRALADRAMDYLHRHGLNGSPLRDARESEGAGPAQFSSIQDTDGLRTLLFLQHGNDEHYLYSDDGEMQCNTCGCDFKTDSAAELRNKIARYNLGKLASLKASKEG